MEREAAFEPLGFKVVSIGGIGDDAGQIAIRGYALKNQDLKLLPGERAAVEAAAQDIAKVPIEVIDGFQAKAATRQNDWSPFNSGAYMINANGIACSTGSP
ncbi:hypothetical protein AB0N65_06810 [Paenarthrobacter sp. NPDC089322]|uniref:hypothetical protein n=1 Tax=Paenarthrobacter sp. NPDC089322 TaxID=3155065 RepID=UPI00342694F7